MGCGDAKTPKKAGNAVSEQELDNSAEENQVDQTSPEQAEQADAAEQSSQSGFEQTESALVSSAQDDSENAEDASGDFDDTVEKVSEAAEEDADVDPMQEFRSKLRRQEGDWYVIHTYAGYENRVRTNLQTRAQSMNMEDDLFEIQVPMEEVVEIKNGQRKTV